MALDAGRLALALAPRLRDVHVAVGAAPGPVLDALCVGIAAAVAQSVVEHIKTDATVLPGTFSTSAGAVTGTGAIE